MTDRSYTGLRAALDAGPKGGKWTWKQVGSFSTPGCAVFWPDTSKGGVHYRRLDSGGGMEQADAEFIACAHPDTIRALLADYDEASARAFYETSVAEASIEQVKKLEAERDGLREALTACIPSLELAKNHMAGSRPDDDDPDALAWDEYQRSIDRASAALAQEQGDRNEH